LQSYNPVSLNQLVNIKESPNMKVLAIRTLLEKAVTDSQVS
jgi:hypothetical protein